MKSIVCAAVKPGEALPPRSIARREVRHLIGARSQFRSWREGNQVRRIRRMGMQSPHNMRRIIYRNPRKMRVLRDIADLAECGALQRDRGGGRSTIYSLKVAG